MLKLINVSKTYKNGDVESVALKGVNVEFGESGIVSILGGSGCGKSTLLNIIGGLLDSSDGELIINDISTANYKATDWDYYRNNYIGFIFQSYYLIPQLNVLENVELTLSLVGMSRETKKQKALAALKMVNLSDQIKKKPNQLSNGQMQRAAIARAIVHNPEIILADEPTGALDSENSVQVMKLLQYLAKDKLVLMVTHNAELAYEYSSRIIKIKDGEIISDEYNTPTAPPVDELLFDMNDKENEAALSDSQTSANVLSDVKNAEGMLSQNKNSENANEDFTDSDKTKQALSYTDDCASNGGVSYGDEKDGNKSTPPRNRKKKPSMSFIASIKLSLKNLYSKLGRTIMTVVAGAIAIISVAVVLGFQNGFDTYITSYEEQSLAQYPITVQKTNTLFNDIFENIDDMDNFDPSSINVSNILNILSDSDSSRPAYTAAKEIYINTLLASMLQNRDKLLGDNNTMLLKQYLDKNMDDSYGYIKYDYALNPDIYMLDTITQEGSDVTAETYTMVNPFSSRLMTDIESLGASLSDQMKESLTGTLSSIQIWEQMPAIDTVKTQYDLLYGSYPSDSTDGIYDIMLVVDNYNQIDDYILYALGVIDINELISAIINPTESEKTVYSFDDFIGMEFKVMTPSAYYDLNEETGFYYLETDDSKTDDLIEERGMTVRISGILRQKQGVAAGCLKGTVVYPSEFAVSFIEQNSLQPAVLAQVASYMHYLEIKDNPDIPASQKKVYSVISGTELSVSLTSSNPNNYFYLLKNLFKVQDTDSPEYIYIYANSVESKEKITNMLNAYNNQYNAMPINQVTFTDNSTAIVNSLSQTVDTVSIILISMTLISVIVAMFMIAIIMYSTVQDRTQEIGILRSIGARQFDIMRIFNVESLLLGFFASIVGIVLSNILALPINAILKSTLGISKLILPTWWHALLLFGFSLLLTLISGAIPAIIASKKNPVTALKTE